MLALYVKVNLKFQNLKFNLRKLLGVRSVLWCGEHGLDTILEGEVQRLGGKVTDAIGQVSAPESTKALLVHGALGAVDDTTVGPLQFALLQHFVL